jgi:Fungal fucose-specific lectin
VCERMYNGGEQWEDGSLRLYDFKAAPFSQLAASSVGDNDRDVRIRVYFQDTDLRIQELVLNNTWSKTNTPFPVAFAGSSLSSVAGMPGYLNPWWIYFQDPSLNLVERWTRNGTVWRRGGHFP